MSVTAWFIFHSRLTPIAFPSYFIFCVIPNDKQKSKCKELDIIQKGEYNFFLKINLFLNGNMFNDVICYSKCLI